MTTSEKRCIAWHHTSSFMQIHTWWRHQNGNIFRVTLPLCGNFTSPRWIKRSVTRSFDVFFDLSLNKTLVKQSRRWWFETPSCSLWHHCYEHITSCYFVLTSPYAPNTFTYKYWYVISYMLLKRLLRNEIIQVIEMFLHCRQWPTYFTVSTQFFAGYFVTHEAWVVTRPCMDK